MKLSFLTFLMTTSLLANNNVFRSGNITNFEPWWFMGGDAGHVETIASEEGIENFIEGEDTSPGESWRWNSRLPNSIEESSLDYLTDSFSIEGNHEIEFSFSINCVNEDGTLNYKSKNNLDDIDIYVFNSDNNDQLASLRIWFDSGGYLCGNHSYQLGSGNDYPNKYSGVNWINGDARLSSHFIINFTKANLFRSYVNKNSDNLVRLDDSSNSFYNASKPLFEDVEKIYFRIRGDGGFAKEANVILRSINGQSLSCVAGSILDNKAPDIFEKAALPSSIEKDQEFVIPVSAVDVLSNPSLSFYYDNALLEGDSFVPTDTGDHIIKVVAIDSVGNTSQKEYPIKVTGQLLPPKIISLPVVEDQTLKAGQVLRCDAPIIEDETGTAVITAKLTNNTTSQQYDLINDTTDGSFFVQIGEDFQSGEYQVVFTVTNSVGSVVSDPVKFNMEIVVVIKPDFVTYDDGITVSYVDEGLLVHSIGRWRKTSFGVFDIRYGIDLYVTIPILASNGLPNTAAYFDMQLINKENENYWIMYRIWLDEQFLTNDSSPTNMYFNFGTPGNSQCVDVNDCGWLTRTVEGVDGRFHLNYDSNDGFSGEFRGVLQSAAGSAALTTRFFDEAGSNNFHVKVYVASRDGGYGDDQNSEFIVNEINNQNLQNTDGVIDVVARPKVSIGTIDKTYKANTQYFVYVYVKDILNLHPMYSVRFLDSEGAVIREDQFSDPNVPLNMPSPGYYKMKIFTNNIRGKEIGTTYDIEVKDKLDPVQIHVEGNYESTYLPGDEIIVYGATYSPNVDLSKTKIYLLSYRDKKEVNAGDHIVLEKAGMYTLDYYACDDANPTVNENHSKQYINVLDQVKPVVNISVNGSLRAKEIVDIKVDVTDDTDCETSIIITDTYGYKTTYFSESASFIPEIKGQYNVSVRVEDSYNNITIETRTIEVGREAPNKTLISWVAIISSFVLILVAFIGISTYMKYKEKKEEIQR